MDGIELSGRLHEIINDEAIIMMLSDMILTNTGRLRQVPEYRAFFKNRFSFGAVWCDYQLQKCEGVEIKTDSAVSRDVIKDVRILLAEDNSINQQLAETILEHFGAKVSVAGNGRKPLIWSGDGKSSLTLSWWISGCRWKDGYEAAWEIRALGTEYADKIPIIALTCKWLQTDIDKSYAAGMNGHLGKPIEPERLVGIIRANVSWDKRK